MSFSSQECLDALPFAFLFDEIRDLTSDPAVFCGVTDEDEISHKFPCLLLFYYSEQREQCQCKVLGEYAFHKFSGDIGQAEIAPLRPISQPCMVYS